MILVVFLLVTAAFISHMESITYFDAFYACFITYSTIGFGDIDIYVSPISFTLYSLTKTDCREHDSSLLKIDKNYQLFS